jgi:hypothetical protein
MQILSIVVALAVVAHGVIILVCIDDYARSAGNAIAAVALLGVAALVAAPMGLYRNENIRATALLCAGLLGCAAVVVAIFAALIGQIMEDIGRGDPGLWLLATPSVVTALSAAAILIYKVQSGQKPGQAQMLKRGRTVRGNGRTTLCAAPRSWVTGLAAWWQIALGTISLFSLVLAYPYVDLSWAYEQFVWFPPSLGLLPSGLLLLPRNRWTWWCATVIMTVNVIVTVAVIVFWYYWPSSDLDFSFIPTLLVLTTPLVLVLIDRINPGGYLRRTGEYCYWRKGG